LRRRASLPSLDWTSVLAVLGRALRSRRRRLRPSERAMPASRRLRRW
jgi:hypothetical protein